MMASTIEGLAAGLEGSISAGNVGHSLEFAQKLTELKARLNIELKPNVNPTQPNDEITIRVHIEDKETSGVSIPFKVRPSDTIRTLKKRMLTSYQFPTQVQCWIIGKRIPKDDDTLYSCEIREDGCFLFLYLLTAQSAGLTRDEFDRELNHIQRQDTSHFGSNNSSVTFNSNQSLQASRQASMPTLTTVNRVVASTNVPVMNARARQIQESSESEEEEEPPPRGWSCPQCTLLNKPTRPGCEMCGADRPEDYVIPNDYVATPEEVARLADERHRDLQVREAEKKRVEDHQLLRVINYQKILETDQHDLIPNMDKFTCPICIDDFEPGDGVMLRECLHIFCRECLAGSIQHTEDAGITCPYQDESYSCAQVMQEREIKALVPKELYEKFLQRGLTLAENQADNSYHCKTTNCKGWCIYEDDVNFFQCEVCAKVNCLTCKAIHEGMNCREYQDMLRDKARVDVEARQTQQALEAMMAAGDAMYCPKCKVVIQKKEGCDWLKCSMCKTEICWATRGPRWGPAGTGDTSGGCGCRINVRGRPCHPRCQNCH